MIPFFVTILACTIVLTPPFLFMIRWKMLQNVLCILVSKSHTLGRELGGEIVAMRLITSVQNQCIYV